MEHNAIKRNRFGKDCLLFACMHGLFDDVIEIFEWIDYGGEGIDISAKDEKGRTALWYAKRSNNAEIVTMIEQYLFRKAVENGDTETVKTYLSTAIESNVEVLYRRAETDIQFTPCTDRHECHCEQMEIQSSDDDLIQEPPPKRFKVGFDSQFISKDSITHSVWLETVAMAKYKRHDEILDLLFNYGRLIHGVNEDWQTILHQLVTEYSKTYLHVSRMLKAVEMLLKSLQFESDVSNYQNETIFEIVCNVRPEHHSHMDQLLRILRLNGFDLNGKNKNGKTFLMLACENKRIYIVRRLLDFASQGYVLDIDAVDNSGETALMKAKKRDFYEIVVVLLRFKFISAVEDEDVDSVKSMVPEFRKALDIHVKSWSFVEYCEIMEGELGERKNKSDIWLEAMYISIENDTKHSEEILKLLLDYDILSSQEIKTGYSISDVRLDINGEWPYDKKLRLYEMLLKCGKINVNDRDERGRTALHGAKEEKLISLLIRYGADVNRRDNEGKTPLMTILDIYGMDEMKFVRTLLKEAGTFMNLDAIDCYGRTALMHAVMLHRSNHVELLLNKGASVNLSDHLGFTALHHALSGNIDEYFKNPQNSKELKIRSELAILFNTEKLEHSVGNNERWNAKKSKIVEMLLQRPDIDVNLLSIEMFSPLDIAEGKNPDIPSSIKNALKEKGAVLNNFLQTESQSTSDFHLYFTCKFKLKQLVKTVCGHKERWLTLIETFKEQKVSYKDQQGKTALHLFAISSFCLLHDSYRMTDLAHTIVDKLISLGCSVNERDIVGRTPLHYANDLLWTFLKSKGADASIKDKDGNISIEKASRYSSSENSIYIKKVVDKVITRPNETYLLRLMNNRQMEINVQCVNASEGESDGDNVPEHRRKEVNFKSVSRLLWEKGEYAFRHPLVEKITEEVIHVMSAIAKEIESLDPRFKITPELVGSSNEGTKIGKPDEFDFCFVLTRISELCEVYHSPELPAGFVHLKRRAKKVGETKESDFDSFFGKDGILNIEKLNWQFTTILHNAIVNIDSQLSFEWILELKIENTIFHNIKKVLNIEMIKPLNFFTVNNFSIDIVPCIHVDGWWHDEAISNVSDEIKKFGCNFVFDRPQKLYPWVPYSKSCSRISFSKAESDIIKHSCDNAREAYMIGKTMIEISHSHTKYSLKNSVLYCIEALSPSSEKASPLGLSLEEMKSKFHQMDRYLWFKCLMKCHLEFVAQDFFPCYFLPNFSYYSPIEPKINEYFKKSYFDWIIKDDDRFPVSCKDACALYRCTLNDISETTYQLPAPDLLWEHFDRKQLIASLCEIAYK